MRGATDLRLFFEERSAEVEAYVDLLQEIERATQSGIPRIAESEYHITAPQQRILYSSVYLQLYNLVEATVSRCIKGIAEAATQKSVQYYPHQLSEELQREWVRSIARTHTDLEPEKRLYHAVELSKYIANKLPIDGFAIDIGGGGNWDDEAIFKIGKRIGCDIQISSQTNRLVKSPLRDDMGSMKLVRSRRNDLAHGSLSFVECADGVTVEELRKTTDGVREYLREVVQCFVKFIDSHDFLQPKFKPNGEL